jgi:hypothetical protein
MQSRCLCVGYRGVWCLPLWPLSVGGSTSSVLGERGKGFPLRLQWLPVVASARTPFSHGDAFFVCHSYFGAPSVNNLHLPHWWYPRCWRCLWVVLWHDSNA